MNNIRIRTTPGGDDKHLKVNINQKFDFIEVLSLKISQEDAYRKYCSDYGAVIGRVIVNNGLGVPNAKVSIFIPIDSDDALINDILNLYPYEVITDRDSNGFQYNLLPNSNRGKNECHTVVGTFPSKREVQDNPEMSEVFKKYYKFTTTTNESGDFILFGVPVGTHYLHVNADISDIGILSQRPYDLISQGLDKNKFYSSTKFKNRLEDSNTTQLKTISPISVNVVPFWGDIDECEIGISRVDVDLKTTIIPSAIFMGSIFSDSEKNSVNKNCRPRRNLGKGDELVTGEGSIDMIRYNNDGVIENYTVSGGRVIDSDGTWAYQIPMNTDYIITSEDGSLIPSEDPSKGIPTRSRVRFKIKMDETGGEGRLRTRANYLVPHNPTKTSEIDYNFNNSTKDSSFTDIYWNKIYTIKNHITRIQKNKNVESRAFTGIKDVDEGGKNNPFPFNKLDTKANPLFVVLCIILSVIITVICLINSILIPLINMIFYILNKILYVVCKVVHTTFKLICGFLGIFSKKKKRKCRESACMGCHSNEGKNCDCRQIIRLMPYIVLPCGDNGRYAVCGKSKGFPFNVTLDATKSKISLDGNNQGDYNDENICYPDLVNVPDNFHYVDDTDSSNHPDNNIPLVNDVGFMNCILLQIAESLNVFKFDFYNDWVNGTLYSFLLKYKEKKNENKYCDYDESDYNTRIVDSCTGAKPQDPNASSNLGIKYGVNTSSSVKINEGYIKRYNGELFYSPMSKNGYKLFATDIVSLGSVFDCDWQGVPKIYPWLIETSYNMPPLTGEEVYIEGSGLVTDVSGFNTGNDGALIGEINCIGLRTGSNQCNNIKRLSELGMGLDERRPNYNVDNRITNVDIENPFIRGAFIFANKQNEMVNQNIPLTYIDKVDVDINYSYDDVNYDYFRNPIKKTIWQYSDSFYFYFGLNSGKTALNKMLSKFFTTCEVEDENVFNVQTIKIVSDDNGPQPTGSIDIEIIGGVGPYTFNWNGPTVDNVEYPIINDTQNISDLFVGTYTVEVIDSIGNMAEATFIVPGPPVVSCDIQSTPTSTFTSSDGQISVNIFSGTPPYIVELYDFDTNNILYSNNVIGNSEVFSNLASGDYKVKVFDSGAPITQCGDDHVTIESPEELTLELIGSNITCFGESNGSVFAQVNGGVAPYSYIWDTGENYMSLGNLTPGNYTVVVTDSIGQTISDTYLISEPPKILYNITKKNTTCLLSEDTETNFGTTLLNGEISINISGGGVPPYEFRLIGGINDINIGPITNTNSYTFTDLNYGTGYYGGNYELIIKDGNGCEISEYINIYRAHNKLGGSLTFMQPNMLRVSAVGGLAEVDSEDINGKVGNYEFIWQNNTGSGWTTFMTTQGSNNEINLNTSGQYRVKIRDHNGTGGICEFITQPLNVNII